MLTRYLLQLVLILGFIVSFLYPFINPPRLFVPEPVIKPEPEPPKKPDIIRFPQLPEKIPDFGSMLDIPLKKQAFFNFLAPFIQQQNQNLQQIRKFLIQTLLFLQQKKVIKSIEQQYILKLMQEYQIDTDHIDINSLQVLLKRIDQLPIELVLMQAANESAWGTSRFARLGRNFFGQWCYTPGCGIVPFERIPGLTHEVAAYDSVASSVRSYFKNINTNPAYKTLREIRANLRINQHPLAPKTLATGLLAYSERGTDYIIDISHMIDMNQRYTALIPPLNALPVMQKTDQADL